ncbi:MAG: SAM-dependent methyltransferase [Chloroflexi bacterium]|nr:SAM-dependent methyltransferase [Chloroflexota bacterium]
MREVDFVASEDTRKTGRLLKHFEISKPQIAFHEHNEARVGQRIMSILADGKSVAVVSDAGTPGISDPGYTLVQLALKNNFAVTMIPGPTALAMAVVLSGLPAHASPIAASPTQKRQTAALYGC